MIAQLARGVFKGWLGVTEAIAAVGAGELAIDVDGDTGFPRARARVVRWEDARCRSGDDEGLGFGKEAKRDADRLVLGRQKRSLAVERINQNAAQSCG